MKRIFITALALSYNLLSYGQCPESTINTTGFHDSYSSTTEVVAQGYEARHWGVENTYTISRDFTSGSLKVIINQEQGMYNPFGVHFLTDGTESSIDISQNKAFETKITNNSVNTVRLLFSFKDNNGNIIDSKPGTYQISEAYLYTYELILEPGQTKIFAENLSAGRHADWANWQMNDVFDYTNLKSVNITAVNTILTNDGTYQPLALVNSQINLDYLKIGNCAGPVIENPDGPGDGGVDNPVDTTPVEIVLLPEPCNNAKFSKRGIFDNYSTASEITSNKGSILHWNTQTDQSTTQFTRNVEGDRLDVIINQGAGQYYPFGVDFGADANGNPVTIDLTKDKSVQIGITNMNNSNRIRFGVSLVDAFGNQVNSLAGNYEIWDAWQYEASIYINPKETKVYDINFAGARFADWANSQVVENFDFSKVVRILITVTNAQLTPENYQPLELKNQKIAIQYLKVGDCNGNDKEGKTNKDVSDDLTISENSFKISPNPAGSVTNLVNDGGFENYTIQVSDLSGSLIKSLPGNSTTTAINLSGFRKGIYVVTMLVDGVPVSNKRLIVE